MCRSRLINCEVPANGIQGDREDDKMKELQRREMLEEALDRFAEGWIAPDNIPGMAVRIKHRGNTLYDKCFGFMDYGQTLSLIHI